MTKHYLDAPLALTDGAWKNRASVQVWVPDDPEAFHRWRTGDQCGSNAGYQRHRKAGEPICEPCRAGHRTSAKHYRTRAQRAAS